MRRGIKADIDEGTLCFLVSRSGRLGRTNASCESQLYEPAPWGSYPGATRGVSPKPILDVPGWGCSPAVAKSGGHQSLRCSERVGRQGAPILYVSFDGVLQPLAYSQVVRVLLALKARGFAYQLLSLERDDDLRDQSRVSSLRRCLEDAGIPWHMIGYDTGQNKGAAARNLRQATRRAWSVARQDGLALTHARSYHGGLVAYALKKLASVSYLFDVRGYWLDERLEEGRWVTRPMVLKGARAVERSLYSHAAGVVSLTGLQALDVRQGVMGNRIPKEVHAIPTCADFSEFQCVPRAQRTGPEPVRDFIRDKIVVSLIGSINASYDMSASVRLGKKVLEAQPKACLLILSRNREGFSRLVDEHGLERSRVLIHSAPHTEMPRYLSCVDWAIMLLRKNRAKRGSVPTKLSECFASGVRVAFHGCNDEVEDWVRQVGTGCVVRSLDGQGLDEAARVMVSAPTDDRTGLMLGRARAFEYFSLRRCVDRYEVLLSRLLDHSRRRSFSWPLLMDKAALVSGWRKRSPI